MATYFAQSSSNINASNVWNTAANGSGSYLTWPPASGDVLMANNKTITVNVDTNLGATGEVRNDTTGGATAGGYFDLAASVTMTANVYAGSTTAQCIRFNAGSPSQAYLVGNASGGTGSSVYAIQNSSNGTLHITGNIAGGSGNTAIGLSNTSTGNVIVSGNVTGGSNTNAHGAFNNSTGTLVITGSATGGLGVTCYGVRNGLSGTLTVGIAVGNAFGNGSTGLESNPGVSNVQTGTCKVNSIQYGARGQTPTIGPVYIEPGNGNQAIFVKSDLTTLTLSRTDGTDFGIPSEADVRYGTSYALGNKTGTCHVPTAAQVSAGIAVDHTTGTAVITEANVKAAIWDAATSTLTTAGSIGERLKNCATVESTGEQLEGML